MWILFKKLYHAIFQVLKILKKHHQIPFIYRVLRKNWRNSQQLCLNCSKTESSFYNLVILKLMAKFPVNLKNALLHLHNISTFQSIEKKTSELFYIQGFTKFWRNFQESHSHSSITESPFYKLVILKLMAKFPVIPKNQITFTHYFDFSIFSKTPPNTIFI